MLNVAVERISCNEGSSLGYSLYLYDEKGEIIVPTSVTFSVHEPSTNSLLLSDSSAQVLTNGEVLIDIPYHVNNLVDSSKQFEQRVVTVKIVTPDGRENFEFVYLVRNLRYI